MFIGLLMCIFSHFLLQLLQLGIIKNATIKTFYLSPLISLVVSLVTCGLINHFLWFKNPAEKLKSFDHFYLSITDIHLFSYASRMPRSFLNIYSQKKVFNQKIILLQQQVRCPAFLPWKSQITFFFIYIIVISLTS